LKSSCSTGRIPLGGARVEGNVADPAYASFVGLYSLAIRHGMTIGEIAAYLNATHGFGCHLTVVAMRGWRRGMLWRTPGCRGWHRHPTCRRRTPRAFIPAAASTRAPISRKARHTRPFEWSAPYLEAHAYADALNALKLPGVVFRAAAVSPRPSTMAGRQLRRSADPRHRRRSFQALPPPASPSSRSRGDSRHETSRGGGPPYEFERKKLRSTSSAGPTRIRKAIERRRPLTEIRARVDPRTSCLDARTCTLSYVLMIAVAPRPTLFAPGRFFVHPIVDYSLIGGGLSLVFAVAMATMALDLTLNGWLATLIIVANGAHFAASTVRLYTRPGVTPVAAASDAGVPRCSRCSP